jgi:hyperosmotically inducible periplasmic protein
MNARTITLAIALAGAAAGGTGCASTRTTGSQIQDMRTSGRVQRRMVLKPDVKRYAIDVDTLDHVVTLRGKVNSETMKTAAEDVARRTKGVKDVNNELKVGKRSHRFADWETRLRVGARLSADPDVARRDIDVDVVGGIVTLSGIVRNETQRSQAEETTLTTPGVNYVVNELRVADSDSKK